MLFVGAGLFIVIFVLSMIKAGNNFSFENMSLENKTDSYRENRDAPEWHA